MGLMGNVFSNSLQLLVAAHCPHRNTSSYVFAQLCNIQMGNVCMSRFKISLFTKNFSVTNLFHLTDSSDTVNVKLKLMIEIGIEVLKGKIRILCYSVWISSCGGKAGKFQFCG